MYNKALKIYTDDGEMLHVYISALLNIKSNHILTLSSITIKSEKKSSDNDLCV